ncbi:general substrate transporter [Thozetella sp. PMI_491]|nr:general substrate transporter [Thozetella sp. PMI_491]
MSAEAHIEDQLKPGEIVIDAAARGQSSTGYEELTLWETVKTFKIVSAMCFAAAFSAGTEGYQIGINASIVANRGFIEQFATDTNGSGAHYLASIYLSSWGSTMSAGQIVGLVTIPFISAQYGRKMAMYWLWVVLFASVLAESLARQWQIWIVAKLLAGIGVGSLQAIIQPYIAELAPVRIRGALTMFYSFWWTIGSFFAQIALQTINTNSPYNWTTAVYSQWGHIGVMLLIYIILPESPPWLVAQGREVEAKKTLARLHRNVPNYNVDHQYELIAQLVEHERAVAALQRSEKWWSIFRGTDGRRTLISAWGPVAQQAIGLKLFSSFATYFFQQAGIPNPFTIKCITTSIQVASVIFFILTADKIGRRPLSLAAVTVSWISCVVVGIIGVTPQTSATVYVFVLFACFWNAGMVGLGSACASLVGETSSQRLRPYTSGFAQAANSIIGLIMDFLVPYMVNTNQWNWGYKTGWFYAGIGGIAVALGFYIVPETKGRSAAELDELFEKKVKAWNFAKTETANQRLRNERVD